MDNNNLIEHKNWGQRNIKWLLTIGIILVSGATLLISLTSSLDDYGRAYSDIPLFERALHQAEGNKEVQNVLGKIQPISKIIIAEGNIFYAGDSVSATVTLKGTKLKGKMDVIAVKQEEVWDIKLIKVRVKQPKQDIIVLQQL